MQILGEGERERDSQIDRQIGRQIDRTSAYIEKKAKRQKG